MALLADNNGHFHHTSCKRSYQGVL